MTPKDAFEAIGMFIIQFGLRAWLIKIFMAMVLVVILWEYILYTRELLRRAITYRGERPEELISNLRESQKTRIAQYDNQSQSPENFDADVVMGSGLTPSSDPTKTPSGFPEIAPIRTFEELLAYEKPPWARGFAPVRPPHPLPAFQPYRSRLLVCHDLAGGYGEDRFTQGGGYEQAYRMYDWGLIDVFVYFGHDFVVIPPAGWIDVAHRHGTRVLGTFITEWDKGSKICEDLLQSEEVADAAAARLTQIALDYGFDGWLVNIENKILEGHDVDVLEFFLKTLTARMHVALRGKGVTWSASASSAAAAASSSSSSWSAPSPIFGADDRALVLWYDSVTTDGILDWQNCLNSKNRRFFSVCDGIFTNYHWRDSYPSDCAHEAKGRRLDVYMGIDTWGRGTWGGGGFSVDKALGKISRAGISAALFAPAWTMQKLLPTEGKVNLTAGQGWSNVEREFLAVNDEFWSKIASAWAPARAIPARSSVTSESTAGEGGLPFVVNFGRGVSARWCVLGEEVAAFRPAQASDDGDYSGLKREVLGGAFYDLASQSLTPMADERRIKGPWPYVFHARSNRGPEPHPKDASFGMVGARYVHDMSFDGGSCLNLSGFLRDKSIVRFTLFRCDVALSPEPLEVNVTFSSNPKSNITLVLVLDDHEHLVDRREIVLGDWGHEGRPSGERVFSKRLSSTDMKATYSPKEEFSHSTGVEDVPPGERLEARVRSLRQWHIPYEKIWTSLLVERGNLRSTTRKSSSVPATSATSTLETPTDGGDFEAHEPAQFAPPFSEWTTRKYVIRDLRLGGYRSICKIEAICSPRRVSTKGGLRAREGGLDPEQEGLSDEEWEDEASLFTSYNACLGELAIGPWQKDASFAFSKVKYLRTTELEASGIGDEWTVDLSLEWELESPTRGILGRPLAQPVVTRNVLSRALHCDIWGAMLRNGDGDKRWRWLGRAYGQKYRLRGLSARSSSEGIIVLAAQQVNAMGYRQPMEECAKVEVQIPSALKL